LRSESRSRIEYLIPTNTIIVLNSYFNLTNKSNLIGWLYYDVIRIFDHLVVAYVFGPSYNVLAALNGRPITSYIGAVSLSRMHTADIWRRAANPCTPCLRAAPWRLR